jgi:transcriptional regulator with XRE-family HTH domain
MIPLTTMAANVGISASYLTDMERGARTMSPKVRRAYLEALGYRAPKRAKSQPKTAPAGGEAQP